MKLYELVVPQFKAIRYMGYESMPDIQEFIGEMKYDVMSDGLLLVYFKNGHTAAACTVGDMLCRDANNKLIVIPFDMFKRLFTKVKKTYQPPKLSPGVRVCHKCGKPSKGNYWCDKCRPNNTFCEGDWG